MKQYFQLLSACLVMAACSDPSASGNAASAASGNAVSTTAASGLPTYHVMTEQSYPPFIMHTSTDQIDGFEYDLLNEIGKRQGFQVRFSPYIFDHLFDTLNNHQSDIISSGITVTEDRKQQVLFSDPYFETETVLLVGKDIKDIQKFSDMRGKKISVKQHTLQDDMVKQTGGQPVYAESSWLTVKNTINRYSDATLGDFGVLSYFNNRYPQEGLQMIKNPGNTKEQLAFAVHKDNTVLQTKINQGLQQIKADGTYQQIYKKWFEQATQSTSK